MVPLSFVELKMTAPFYLLSSSFPFYGAGCCDTPAIKMLLLPRGTDRVHSQLSLTEVYNNNKAF
jgi:hypothetical protein